jgi:hypothetical protein
MIHESHEYVKKVIGDTYYQLQVTNQWDWSTNSICFKDNYGFYLEKVKVITLTESRVEKCLIISDEMKLSLVNKGYKLSSKI